MHYLIGLKDVLHSKMLKFRLQALLQSKQANCSFLMAIPGRGMLDALRALP